MAKNNFKKRLKIILRNGQKFSKMKNFGGSRKKVHSKSITFGSKITFFERKMLKNGVKTTFF